MYLRIMSERFKMTHTLDRVLDRFLIQDLARSKANADAAALLHKPFYNFRLHLAHEMHMDLAELLKIGNVKLRELVLKL